MSTQRPGIDRIPRFAALPSERPLTLALDVGDGWLQRLSRSSALARSAWWLARSARSPGVFAGYRQRATLLWHGCANEGVLTSLGNLGRQSFNESYREALCVLSRDGRNQPVDCN